MNPFGMRTVQHAYEAVAEDYAAAFGDDLLRLPVDRAVLNEALEHVGGSGLVLDLGCGPGQVGQYLFERSATVIGVDLAPSMLRIARRDTQVRAVVCADVRALPFRSASVALAVAFYSLHHLPRAELGAGLREIRRTLSAAGLLVVATHVGEGEVFSKEFLGHRIAETGGTLYPQDELEDAIRTHSFLIERTRTRGPLPNEHPSQRMYLIARLQPD